MSAARPWWNRGDVGGPWFPVGSDAVRLLRDGVESFPAMLEAIASAKREILLEMYWVGPDPVGIRFREALAEKARQGVTVRVIYDAVGSLSISPSFWETLLRAGGEVREYHPLSPFRPTFALSRLEQRDHRKILVVDGHTGFTGGINLALPWLAIEDGGESWRDDMVETQGHVTQELRTLFYKTWRRVWFYHVPKEQTSRLTARPEARGRRGAGERIKLDPKALVRGGLPLGWELPRDLVPLSKNPSGRIYVLASLRRSKRNLMREYLHRINRAVRSVDIANSYFIPDRNVRGALLRAVLRGVRVRVLVPAKSDVAVVQFALEAMYETLLRGGVELYAFPGPMMHAKTTIIDDRFATIGSYNLDERSRANLEVNVAVQDEPFATYVRGWFDRDLERCEKLDLYRWRARPLARRGVEYLAYAMRKLW